MGFAGFVTSGVVPALSGALRGGNERARMNEEQRRYDAGQARLAQQMKWEQQQALEASQRQAMMDALAVQAQQAAQKGAAESRAIQMAALNKPPTPQESYQEMVGDKGPGLYGITEGQPPRHLGGVIPKPVGGGSGGGKSVGVLRREFNSFVKPYEGLAQAYRKIRGAASDPSAAGDLSVVFGYMKLLDPASVVRESEQATAVNARGVPDTIRSIYNRVLTGERLTPAQRQDFVQQSRNLLTSQRAALSSQVNRYRAIAEANDIDAEQVVYDPFEGLAEDEEPAADQPTPSGMTPAQEAFERWQRRGIP